MVCYTKPAPWSVFRAALNAGWSSYEYDICPYVRLTNACIVTNETSAHILISHERTFTLVFWKKEWLVGNDPLYLKFLVSDPVGAKSTILNRYSLVAPQP